MWGAAGTKTYGSGRDAPLYTDSEMLPAQLRTADRTYEPSVDNTLSPHTDPLGISLRSEGPSWLSSPPGHAAQLPDRHSLVTLRLR